MSTPICHPAAFELTQGAQARGSVTHIVPSVDDEAAGPSYSVPRLCLALSRDAWDVRLASLSEKPTNSGSTYRHDTFRKDFAHVPVLGRLNFSAPLYRSLAKDAASRRQVLHAHGLWLMPNIYPAWIAARTGRPLVVSPRGMLGEAALRFSRRRKQAMWALAQRNALRRADCFHATSWQEFDDIRAAGFTQPVAVIPNGIDLPTARASESPARRTALYLGRLHPKKGLDLLLRAWALVESTSPDWDLAIVGPSELGYREELQSLATTLRLRRVIFEDAVYGDQKQVRYDRAALFVMPTQHENFGMTVAEALASDVPVLCSKGAPWQDLETHRCGWWVDRDVESFGSALRMAMEMEPQALAAMGRRGRDWMQACFGWDAIGRDMGAVYRWLLAEGSRPPCVFDHK